MKTIHSIQKTIGHIIGIMSPIIGGIVIGVSLLVGPALIATLTENNSWLWAYLGSAFILTCMTEENKIQ